MHFIRNKATEPLILEVEEHTEEEWKILCKIFGLKEAERIVVKDYTLEAWGELKQMDSKSKRVWKTEEGVAFRVPGDYCVFCKHCEDILWDYTHGPYVCLCNLGNVYGHCNKFEEDKDE